MADVTMNAKVLNVTKTTAEWAESTTAAKVISKGLLCIETDTNNKSWAKVGDGVHTYSELPYITDGAIASLGTVIRIKGVKASTSELPQSGNVPGDLWFVGTSGSGTDNYEEYVWTTENAWEFIGSTGSIVIPVYQEGDGIDFTTSGGITTISIEKAASNNLGGVIIGSNISVANDGTISVPTASDSTAGVIKVGTNLSISEGVLSATDTTYTFDGTYDASTNKAATVSTVTTAIGNLDGSITGSAAASKTLTAFSQTDGVVTATFSDIAISNTQVSGLGDAAVKGVTDNSTETAVTSSDTNLITARTLYYAGYTKNVGTVTGITMNGSAKTVASDGTVDLGTVITDVSGKADVSTTVTSVSYDTTNKKFTKTINGIATDIVSLDTTATENSVYPITSGAVYTGLSGKVNTTDSLTLNCTL